VIWNVTSSPNRTRL